MKPKFTLRDLMWLVLMVAIVLGWWLQHSATVQRLGTIEAELWLANSNFADVRQYFESQGYKFSYTTDGLVMVAHPPANERNP